MRFKQIMISVLDYSSGIISWDQLRPPKAMSLENCVETENVDPIRQALRLLFTEKDSECVCVYCIKASPVLCTPRQHAGFTYPLACLALPLFSSTF